MLSFDSVIFENQKYTGDGTPSQVTQKRFHYTCQVRKEKIARLILEKNKNFVENSHFWPFEQNLENEELSVGSYAFILAQKSYYDCW